MPFGHQFNSDINSGFPKPLCCCVCMYVNELVRLKCPDVKEKMS